MTTNGIGLDKVATRLVEAGLGRINVSLDTVDREHFARLTRRDRLPAVLAGIDGAVRAGLGPIKVNAVLMRETLEDAPGLLAWALERGLRLRFIEQMPLDADAAWRRANMVPAAELLEVLVAAVRADVEAGRDDPSAPAEEWLVDGGPATVGIIASVTRSFCSACDRTRITAEGTVRSCLFGDDETDLRALLRGGATRPRDRRPVARRDVGQAGRPRHRRPRASCRPSGRWARSVADVRVRYFAAAADAAGRDERPSRCPEPRSASCATRSSRGTARRWRACCASGSFLVDGVVSRDRERPLGAARRRAAAVLGRLTLSPRDAAGRDCG